MKSLRTRLFVILGSVLAVSIVATGLLSRRATLIEVQEFAPRVEGRERFEAAASLIQQRLVTGGVVAARDALPAAGRDAGRPLLWLDDTRSRVLAASPPSLAQATVRAIGDGDELEIRSGDSGLQFNTLVVAGGPMRELRDAAGTPAGVLVGLPRSRTDSADMPRAIPTWILPTAVIGIIGLVLTFALSRQILQPVSALTAAARQMESGDLAVRVARHPSRSDEIANLADAFNAMAARLSETERLRRQLVSDVAHELRSPVTNLRVTLEAMQDGLMPLDRARLDALHDETVFLQRLLTDLQDLTLADAGQLPLRTEPVDLSDTLRRSAAALDHRGARIQLHVPPALIARGDPDRLEQVFRNLLSNARRHTPDDGRIDIRAVVEQGWIRIDVADTGEGIDAAHLPHVFDRFYRADASRARATGGAGLGLAIVRQLVAAHGGTVSAHSPGAGGGTTITVRLPTFMSS